MIKDDFPYFKKGNVYLDNASTTQKPQSVIDSVNDYYINYCSNIHRGSHKDGNRATTEYEATRDFVRDFIGASSSKEIIFTKGVTEGINLVASSFVRDRIDTVIISSIEHHSNIVPWHMLGKTLDNGLEVVNIKDNLEFDLEHFETLVKKHPNSMVAVSHVSNAFGVVHPIKEITEIAHKYGVKVLVDGAQAPSRMKVDVKSLGADFYVFSGHKCYGPTGVGILYVNKSSLYDLKPYQTGGAVIDAVSFNRTTFLGSPYCFEAGTQNIAGVIGLKAALEYIQNIGYENISSHEAELTKKTLNILKGIEGIELYTNDNIVGNISFNIKGISPLDLGVLLDKQGVAVRVGNHCAMPIMEILKIQGTVRLSFGVYNNQDDIDKFEKSLIKAIKILGD